MRYQPFSVNCYFAGPVSQLTFVLVTLTPMGEMAWSDPAKSGPVLQRIPVCHPLAMCQVVAKMCSPKSPPNRRQITKIVAKLLELSRSHGMRGHV